MQFATRVQQIEESEEFAVKDIVTAAESDGKDVIDLSVGQPDFETPDAVIEAGKRALDAGHTTYTPVEGIHALRRTIAEEKFQKRDGIPYEPEHVLVTPGARHALYVTVQTFIDDGDEVILFDPSFTSFDSVVKLAGGQPRRVDLSAHGFALEPAIADLEAAITPETRMMIINAPNNPSGMTISETALDRVGDLAIENDLVLVSDEIYNELIYENEQESIASFEELFDRTVTINGFSKTYAMTGWRLGYMAAPTDIVEQATTVSSHSVSCAPDFVQRAGVEALTNPDVQTVTEEMVETFQKRRDAVLDALSDRSIDVPVPDAAFYLLLPIPETDDKEWTQRAIREAGVAAVPGGAFGTPGYVRLALVEPENRLREAIDRLERNDLLPT